MIKVKAMIGRENIPVSLLTKDGLGVVLFLKIKSEQNDPTNVVYMLNSKTVVGISKIENFRRNAGRIARQAKIAH